jgi:ribosomal protein S18 acetylase RimI-like enzyme
VAAENAAQERGALTMTLHVFANNTCARHVYEELGYSGEILRYIKDL